jgi:hypothetical protein
MGGYVEIRNRDLQILALVNLEPTIRNFTSPWSKGQENRYGSPF